jgi:hypothetical protein
VLPVLKQRLNPEEQLEMVRGLLVDSMASDSHWVMDWIVQHLNPEERATMAGFEEMFVS